MIKEGKPYTNEHCNGKIDALLVDDLDENERKALLEWIKTNLERGKKVNRYWSSYGLKLQFQDDTKIYVTNNQFKDGMMRCGFFPRHSNEVNWYFRIKGSSKVFDRIKRW